MLDQCQLGLNGLAIVVQLQGFGVGVTGHARVQVTQIFMGRSVAGVGANRLLQHLGGFAFFTFGCVQHRKVVVGLRQPRVLLRERRENLNGLVKLLLFSRDHALQKAHLHVVAVFLEVALNALRSFVDFSTLQQLVDLGRSRL